MIELGGLIEQWTDLGSVALLVARQLGGEDLAATRVNGQIQLAPRPGAALAVLFDQPLAGAVNLQARRVEGSVRACGRNLLTGLV